MTAATSPCSSSTCSAPSTRPGRCSGPRSTAPAGRCPTTPPSTRYCAAAGVDIDIHQLRHSHATELINAGVSIEAVRRRLGHASTETTQLYALLDDKVADDEIRAARRRAQARG
ncbi:tyrosine-type recombinase/integrase [Actinoplanes sp. CA-054009]